MATFNRYTDFPDLRSQINRLELEDHKQVQRSITVDTECLHHEDLILAWAALLHAYAGGEDIIFAVDGDTVKVNVLDETVTLIEADARSSDNNINGCRTAIYTKDDDDPSFPLCVCVAKDRVISIVVNTNMLSSELSTRLAKELAARIRWRRQYPGQVVRWHENDDLQLSMLNRKPQHMEGPCLLHHLFEGHALKEMYAVEYLGPDGGISRLSYKDVYRLSRDLSFELGKVLYEHNSTPYAALRIVPILIPQSPALYIAVLAVLMAGAAFCPLDPDAPQERIKFITGDLSAKVILTDEVFASRFCWTGCPEVMVLDPNLSLCHRRTSAQSLRIPESTSNDLAYVMYTSGSTGTPKGVGISHSAVTQSLLAHDEHIPHFRRFVQFAAPTFDVFVFELFFPFFRGSTLICCSRRDLLNDLPNIMNRMGVDAAVLTPTVVGGLIRKRDHVPDLKVLMTIGEMLTRPVIEEFGASDERAGVLYAMYGPTEASIHCTIAPTLHARSKAGMIGQPLVTVSAFIISPPSEVGASSKLEILPAGHVGELALGGYQLADGYFNRLEQTSQAFFELAGYGRIYRTGDKARLLPDGNLECLGRLVTDQVKVRGHRLELGEVEQVVSNLPNVRTAIATVVDGNLVVFCVPEDAHASVETVLEECRHWLPAPLVPEDVVLLDDVPRSPSGKADRKALEYKYRKNITQARGKGSSRRSVANGENSKKAWKPEERSIREVFSRLSAIEESHITQKTTIFQIGLDSVSAVHVAAGLRDQGWSVSAVDVLQYTSVEQLGLFLEGSKEKRETRVICFDFATFEYRHRTSIVSDLRIPSSDLIAIRPCTPEQSGMIASFINSDGSMYLTHMLLRLNNGASLKRLRKAWEVVVEKHSMLRTGFTSIRHPQHPFVMLEYRAGVKDITWYESNKALPMEEAVEEHMRQAQLAILSHVHDPAWQLSIHMDHSNAYLQICAIHALFDAQSLQIILDDVGRAYEGHNLSPSKAIEPVLGAMLSSTVEDEETNRQYWQSMVGTMQTSKFPNMSPLRLNNRNISVRSRPCSWSQTQLEKICGHFGVTVSAAGQGAWSRVLSAYLNQEKIMFGLVLSARTLLDVVEGSAFPCTATLPLSCNVQSTNLDLLRNIMELNASMRTHQYTSLQCIQQWSGHGHESPFDTIFVYQKFADNTLEVPLPWTVVDEGVAVNFPISLELRPLSEGDQILFQLTFQEDLLPSDQADLLLQQLDFTFLDILSNPESSCNDFSGFAPDLLSVRLAKEPAIPSASHLLHQFVEIHACATPHKVALEFVTSFSNGTVNKRQWTYSELDAESNKVASLLLGSGLLPGDLVAISFRKCPEASFAILGILKAGCAYVALDPDAPVARKHFIIEDSGAKLLLTLEEQTAEVQDNMLIPIITLNTKGVFDGLSDEAPSLTRPTQPGDVCYCLYTSGTTGTPKGCDITHENAVQAILAFQRTFFGRWDAESRWLQFASYHFDVSVLEQFWSWSVGICVTSAPRDLILEDISEVIRQLRITHLDLTPSLARTLHPDYVPLLCGGVFITGGELLKQDILDEWGPKACIYNAYGPTEATIGVTVFPQMPANGRSSNIGTQFDNVGTYVLQPGSSRPVLRGAVGELCVSGKLVGRGYRNRPELTNKRFQTLERYNERIYRTGDLVRMLHDGSFDFLGRGDDQVKIRGQRLEVMEINEVVKEVKQVSEVATLVIKHPRQQKEQLVSFVVLGDGLHNRLPASIEFNPKDPAVIISIQRACRAKLPIYGVPTHIIPLTSLPLSANHKADVNKLKDIYTNASLNELQNLSSCRSSHSNKWTSRERQLVTALADFLRAETRDITRDSNVFELGLDSISVTGLARVLRENGFTNSKPSLIMRNGMVGDLLKALQEEQRVTSSLVHSQSAAKRMTLIFQQKHSFEICRALGVKFDSVESIAPCTPLQQGMIATSLKSKGSLYFNAFYFEMSPETSLERLRKAWEKVHKQCQILRTIFFPTEDGFAQVSVKSATPSWRILSALSDKEVEKIKKIQYEDWCRHNSQTVTKPFEVVVIQGISTTVMCVHIFHALYDGNSLQMTLQRLSQEYKDETQIDYGLSFQEILSLGPLCEPVGAEDFWLEHMRHASPVRMPSLTDNSSRGDNEALLDIENMTGFEEVRRKLNTTHQSLIQACWLSVLKPYFKNGVTIGVVVSGRATDIDGADKVIGPLFNTIPFFLDYESSETWIDIVRKCHAFSIDSLPYQQVPLRDITKWCKRSTDQPLFDTLFVFDKELEQPSTTSPDLWRLVESRSEADFQLSFEAQLQLDGRLKLKILAQNSTSDERSSTSLLEKFVEKLRHLIKNPEGRLDSGTDHEEQGTLPANATATSYPQPFSDVDGTQEDFAWTEKAYLILEEVAALACLEASEISAHISILQLGLDSIDAAKLASRLKRRGLMLGISTIMRTLTIANMAEYLPEETDVKVFGASCMKLDEYERVLRDHLNGIHVELGDVEAVLPATAFQEAMIANMIKSQQTTYFNHDVLQITTDVDFDKLMDAWETVVASTPILRTSFMEIDHPDIPVAYVQVVHRFRKITWEIIQLPDEATLQDTFKQSTMQDVRESLEQPPFSLNIYEYKKKHYMILSIAHMLYDGWCLHLLHQDVRRVYHGSYVPRPSYVPVLERILQATDEAAKDFWKSQLKGVEGTVFPRSKFQTEHETQRHVHREYISSVSAQSVRTFCKAQNITLQALGYTCWTFILASYTQKLDVVFGAVFSGRDSEEEEEVFFPTMSTVAVRSTIHGSRRDMLRYMYDINRSIAQFQHYPLRMAQRFAEHQAHELFNTLFIIQKRPEEINDQGEGLYQSVDGASSTEYPLCVELEVVGDDVIWRATSEESTLDHEGMQRFLHEIDSIADAIIKNPDGPSFDLTEGGISICGLRSFTPSPISGSKTTNSSETKESSDLDPEWIDVEKSIRKVLSLVSKVPEDQIQKSQTIFHLGLDSISAIKVSSLLRRQSIRLSVSQLLKAATISNMAAVHARSQVDLDEDSKTDTQSVLRKEMEGFDINSLCIGAGIDPARVEKMIPATAGQVCFLSIWQNTRGTLFHSTFEYKCQGLLDKTRLDEAWRSLLTQSPILRSTFVATDQRRLPILQVMLKDYRPGAVRGREEGGLPLVNLRVQHDSGGTLLQLEILHALYDAISLPLIISYLQMFYHNPEAQITPQPQLDDFLALTLSGSDQPKRKEFWKTYLGSPTKLQNRSFRESKSDAVTRTEVFQPALLPKASHLERTARLHGVTIQSLFLAAYAKAFAAFLPRYEDTSSGQIDVIFGIYLVNRSHPLEGLPKLAAPTVNIVPLKVTISPPSKSLIAMAMQIQEDLQLISNLQNSAVSLWEIDEWTGIKLNSTVNFLRLLDSDDYDDHGSEQDRIAATVDDKDKSSGMVHCDGDDKEKEKEKQQFHPVLPPEWNSGIVLRRQTTTTSQEGQTAFVEPIALATNLVRDSYLPSVDIEARIQNDALQVGIFGSADLIALDEADGLLRVIREELCAVVGVDGVGVGDEDGE